MGEPLTVFDDGQQTRSFTDVDDTMRGTILAGTLPGAVGQVLNIGSDRETTIVGLADMIRELVGSDSGIVRIPFRQVYDINLEGIRRRAPDVRRAEEILGLRAQIPL